MHTYMKVYMGGKSTNEGERGKLDWKSVEAAKRIRICRYITTAYTFFALRADGLL